MTLEARILSLLASRRPDASICPSEVARDAAPDDWRPLMPAVRDAAARLVEQQRVTVTQKNRTVDVRAVKGPIRLKRGPEF